MVGMIDTINVCADEWLKTMGTVLWQTTLLVVLAGIAGWWLKRYSPVIRYCVWQIVAIKMLVMPFWTVAVPLPLWMERSPPPQSAVFQSSATTDSSSRRLVVHDSRTAAEAADTSPPAQTSSFWGMLTATSWQARGLLLWLAIVFLQLVRLLYRRWRLAALLRQGVPASGELARLVAELARRVGLARAPITLSLAWDCPIFVCGFWRPQLVVSNRILASLNPAALRQVILHELGHVKRRDLLWVWPMEIARMVYFFNPLVHWAVRQLRLEQELVCDQLAMAHSGHTPADYAQTLVEVIGLAVEPAALQAAASSASLAHSQHS